MGRVRRRPWKGLGPELLLAKAERACREAGFRASEAKWEDAELWIGLGRAFLLEAAREVRRARKGSERQT